VETSQSSPARETKRMMKLQDAMWKALGMKITWIEAASDRRHERAQYAADAAALPETAM